MPYDEEIPMYEDLVEPPAELDELARIVIGAAIEVHRHLGPGLPDAVYEAAMVVELNLRGVQFEKQKIVDIFYKGVHVGKGKIDLLIAGKLVVELKSCDSITPVFRLQTRSYMRIIRQPLGLLINFDVPLLKDGVKRVIQSF